jgi:magnesium chelatase family protein
VLTAEFGLADAARSFLDEHLSSGALTRRGVTRVHRLAWTVADLAGVDRPGQAEVEVAFLLRTGQPLPVRALAVPR